MLQIETLILENRKGRLEIEKLKKYRLNKERIHGKTLFSSFRHYIYNPSKSCIENYNFLYLCSLIKEFLNIPKVNIGELCFTIMCLYLQ